MSHQTGIRANDELLRFFGSCRNGNIRTFTMTIETEELKLGESFPAKGKWEDEYDLQVVPLLQEKQPCYIMFRLDSNAHGGFEWILLCWSPDDSPIRQKMLYASTKASFKKEFGATQISDEVFGSIVYQADLKILRENEAKNEKNVPRSNPEEERAEIKSLETGVDISVDSKQQTLAGVAFPMVRDALEAIKKFAKGDYQYLRLRIVLCYDQITLNVTGIFGCYVSSGFLGSHCKNVSFIFDFAYSDCTERCIFLIICPLTVCLFKEAIFY
ncbi:unnamed protein product, partial [Meganyctiphanes norvegica]